MSDMDKNENLTVITITVQHLADSGFDIEHLMDALHAQVMDEHGVKTYRSEHETETNIWGVAL